MPETFRIEEDSLGSIEVPMHALWGAQTQRCLVNFSIGKDRIPDELIYALAQIKQAAAIVNHRLDNLERKKCDAIVKASKEIREGIYNDHFPLNVWQTGSGTQTNMNINEVISNIASQQNGEQIGSHKPLHPNDDVNKSQSTNDTFPAAIHIATVEQIKNSLLPEIASLIDILNEKSIDWKDIVKIGRTHLQDAVPLTLGQEVSAWRDQVKTAYNRIEHSLTELYPLPLGGTAIGTGINCPESFDTEIAKEISQLSNHPFSSAVNKFAIMASHDGLVNSMSQIKLLAVTLLKIVNDIRLLSCGPRGGLGELELPANEPGSSIMPGKINPTQCEAMAMVCIQILGLEGAVANAGSSGQLQMNVYKPLIGFNLLKSIELIRDATRCCREMMLNGMKPNLVQINQHMEGSLMLVTALTPVIGYKKASRIAQLAHKDNTSLKKAANKLGYISDIEFDEIVDPIRMTNPNPNPKKKES